MTGRYEQMRIQVPIAKDTPIERIYEGAGYIHRLRYPQGCVEKKEAGDEWPAHTKKISSGAYRAAVNAFDEKHILPALHAKRSVLLNAGTTMDVPTTAAELAKIESDLYQVYLRMIKDDFLDRASHQTILTLEKLEDIIYGKEGYTRADIRAQLDPHIAEKAETAEGIERYRLKSGNGIYVEFDSRAESDLRLRTRLTEGAAILLDPDAPAACKAWLDIAPVLFRKGQFLSRSREKERKGGNYENVL